MSHNEKILQAALGYAARGWPVFVVRGKKAAITDWPNAATKSPEQIHLWWKGPHAGANIGIVTGKRSGFFVLDVDRHEVDGEETLRALEQKHGSLPDTVEQLTGGGGRHLLFRMPAGVNFTNRTGKNAIAPGLEIKTDGGYIVSAPSTHPITGKSYEWEVSHHPDDVPISDAPAWLIALITAKPKPQEKQQAPDVIAEGGRNDHLTRLAGSMRRPGMSEAAMLAALRVENETRCSPPLPDNELQTIAKSVARYTPEPMPTAQLAEIDALGEEPRLCGVQCFSEDGQFIPPILADAIMNYYRFAVQNQQLYVYKNGVFVETSPDFIKKICKRTLLDRYRDNRGLEVAKEIMTAHWRQENFFIDDIDEINVINGILNWRTGALRPHNPDYPSRVRIPVMFDIGATCPSIERFFADVLHPDCIDLASELFGHCLIPDTSMQKAFLLKSGGESGKSVFLDLLTIFLGRANVSHEKLQDLGENRFRAANLVGKLANIFADLPASFLEVTDVFKTLVSGDGMSAERKCQHPFAFRNTARLLFSANELPRAADNSHGYFRRWLIIDFPNCFPVGSPTRDELILQKLTEPRELSGLLNIALAGLRRLKTRGYFNVPASAQNDLEEYQRTNDSVRLFCSEFVTEDNQCRTDRAALFARYRNFCIDENLKPVSGQRFCAKLRGLYPNVEEIKSHGTYYWIGIVCDV